MGSVAAGEAGAVVRFTYLLDHAAVPCECGECGDELAQYEQCSLERSESSVCDAVERTLCLRCGFRLLKDESIAEFYWPDDSIVVTG